PVHAANSGISFFGMTVNALTNGTPWPVVPVGTLRLMGTPTNWNTLNPAAGEYTWGSLDRQIEQAQANNADMLYTFTETPPWALATNLQITSIGRSGGVVTGTTT